MGEQQHTGHIRETAAARAAGADAQTDYVLKIEILSFNFCPALNRVVVRVSGIGMDAQLFQWLRTAVRLIVMRIMARLAVQVAPAARLAARERHLPDVWRALASRARRFRLAGFSGRATKRPW